MGDYLSYGNLTGPTAADVILACRSSNAEVLQSPRSQFLPSIIEGSTTLTGVGTIVLTSGTLTGSSGNTAGLGTATLTLGGGGGGGGLPTGPIYGNIGTFSIPDISSFSTISTGGGSGAAFSQGASGAPIIFSSGGSGASGMALLKKSVSGSFTFIALVEPQGYEASVPGIFVSDGSNYAIAFIYEAGSKYYIQKYSSPTSYVGDAANQPCYRRGPVWHKITFDGTNLSFYLSANGIDWSAMQLSLTLATLSLSGVTQVGFAIYAGGDMSGTMAHYLWHLTIGA